LAFSSLSQLQHAGFPQGGRRASILPWFYEKSRRSLLVAECSHRVKLRCPVCRNEARGGRNEGQQRAGSRQSRRIVRGFRFRCDAGPTICDTTPLRPTITSKAASPPKSPVISAYWLLHDLRPAPTRPTTCLQPAAGRDADAKTDYKIERRFPMFPSSQSA
jgi:hypothetical protein